MNALRKWQCTLWPALLSYTLSIMVEYIYVTLNYGCSRCARLPWQLSNCNNLIGLNSNCLQTDQAKVRCIRYFLLSVNILQLHLYSLRTILMSNLKIGQLWQLPLYKCTMQWCNTITDFLAFLTWPSVSLYFFVRNLNVCILACCMRFQLAIISWPRNSQEMDTLLNSALMALVSRK